MNEAQLENLCLEWFREGGWDVFYGPDLAPEAPYAGRRGFHAVLLEDVLILKIKAKHSLRRKILCIKISEYIKISE